MGRVVAISIHLNILLAAFTVLIAPSHGFAGGKRERPNIVLIMIDDLGWSDLHCQGNKRLHTPNIDKLASQGMRFTDAYAAAPVCSPTRAAVLTGMAPARLKLTNHISTRDFTPKGAKLLPAETRISLALEYTTIAERLRAAGYVTGFIGKWHLAGTPRKDGKGDLKYYPTKQGYDLNIGGCAHGGPPSFFDPYRIHTIKDRKKGEYLPYRLAEESEKFIAKNKDRPFFLTLWPYTVHWPMQAPENIIKKYEKKLGYGLKDARYGAMIEAMDQSVGRIMDALEKHNLADNTIVIFTSDNGGYSGVADNRPLRSGKGYLYEGGIRVPLIVRWPGRIEPKSICRVPVISMDFYPTFLEVAGLKADPKIPCDGESLIPLWSQKGKLKRDAIYFHYPNYAWHSRNRLGGAIRKGDYVLLEHYDDKSVELYDLSKDIGQKNNLAKQMPERANELRADLDRWLERTGAAMPTVNPKRKVE